jgi:hypothetical protein
MGARPTRRSTCTPLSERLLCRERALIPFGLVHPLTDPHIHPLRSKVPSALPFVVRLCFTGVRLYTAVRLETLSFGVMLLSFGVMLCAEVPLDLLLLAVRAVEKA